MKKALKLAGGLVCAAVLCALGLIAFLVLTATQPPHPVGIQQVLAADSGHQPVAVTIFYPTRQTPRLVWLAVSFGYLAPDAAITSGRHPLIVISHGTGASSISNLDTALALAEAGYVVAAPLHNGDNFQDQSEVATGEWFVNRTREIARVNDFMLDRWKNRYQLDAQRVGLFGFSAGGTTALIAIGGTPDLARIEPHCKSQPEFVCGLRKPGAFRIPVATEWTHDPRVKAAVVVAPGYGFTFEPNGLSAVRARVQLWEGSADESLPLASNAATVRRLLPDSPEFHLVENAGHFSFLAPCSAVAHLLMPRLLCADARGFDRKAFHDRFNASVVAFFDERLPNTTTKPAGQDVANLLNHPAH